MEFVAMVRGTPSDAAMFEQAGIAVRLNATDDERASVFGSLDVFFSASRWEGFNLSLVEAQHCGRAAIPFDTGAHPETTPYVVGSLGDAETLLRYWIDDRAALAAAASRCLRFVDERFSWDESARRFSQFLDEVAVGSLRGSVLVRRAQSVVRREGVGGSVRKVLRRVRRR